MKKELSTNIFIPYSLHIENEEDHLLLLKIIDTALDTYSVRDLPTEDFEYVKRIIER